jgi:hypothetical protein
MTDETKSKVLLGSAIIAGVLAIGTVAYYGIRYLKNKKKVTETQVDDPAVKVKVQRPATGITEADINRILSMNSKKTQTSRDKFMVSVLKRIETYDPHPDIEKFDKMTRDEIITFLVGEYDAQSYKLSDIEECRRYALCVGGVSSGFQFSTMEEANASFNIVQKALSTYDNKVRTTLMMWLLKGMQFSAKGDLASSHQMLDLVVFIVTKKLKLELTDKLMSMSVKKIPDSKEFISAIVEIDCICHIAGPAYRPGDPACTGSLFAERFYRKTFAEKMSSKLHTRKFKTSNRSYFQ